MYVLNLENDHISAPSGPRGKGFKGMITDYDLQALIDCELRQDEAQRIQEKIANSPLLRWRYDELARQNQLLKQWWQQKIKN